MTRYYQLSNFKLPVHIEAQLHQLDWQQLPVASVFDKKDWVKIAYQRNILFELFKYYGWRCQRIGTLLSTVLPKELENLIRIEIDHLYGVQIASAAIIRMQVIYGGNIIPIHTDIARESGIVYPITHSCSNTTQFYNSDRTIERGMLPPSWCIPTDSVSIDNHPVLLDISVPHAIIYSGNTYTKTNPRISLSLKFEKLDFQTVKDLVK
jgi:hypothetical protein